MRKHQSQRILLELRFLLEVQPIGRYRKEVRTGTKIHQGFFHLNRYLVQNNKTRSRIENILKSSLNNNLFKKCKNMSKRGNRDYIISLSLNTNNKSNYKKRNL